MSGGIGESMLIGAAVGGGTALVTGNDPLRGALLGGITGGIGGAAFGGAAAGGAGGAAGGAAAGGAGAAVGQGAAGLTSAGISTAVPASQLSSIVTPTLDVASGIASGAGGAGTTLGGITGLNPTIASPGIIEGTVNPVLAAPMQGATQIPQLTTGMGPGGLSEIGMANQFPPTAVPNSTWVEKTYTAQPAAGITEAAGNASPGIQLARDQYGTGINFQPQVVDQAGNLGMTQAAKAPQGMFDRFGKWYGTLSPMEKVGVGIAGGVGMQALGGGFAQPTLDAVEEEENPFGFATYDRRAFSPYIPTPNVYRPGYAGGGIASIPQNNMFPQGLQNATQYATPTQMPTSAEVVRADYDPMTNPYSGEPIGMAEGGNTKEALSKYLASMDPKQVPVSQVIATPPAPTPTPPTTPAEPAAPKWQDMSVQERISYIQSLQDMGVPYYRMGMGGKGGIGNPYGMTYSPYGRQNMYGKSGFRTSDSTGENIARNFAPYISPAINTRIYRPQFAQGGITGDSHLGDYARGGMPRLLKGPGDGMSDDIPAVIANKQPARLADGEFVIPADVVSHLGNGSTDAGAKHLHKMMDRVRKARTGKKAQGKQIKPAKFLPA